MNIIEGFSGFNWGEIVYNPYSVLGPRLQRNYQLVLVHSGSVEIEVDGVTFGLNPGEVILLRPEQMEYFQFSKTEKTHHSWVHAEGIPRKDPWSSARHGSLRVVPTSDRLGYLIRQLIEGKHPAGRIQRTLYNRFAEAAFLEYFSLAEIVFEEPVPLHPAVERSMNIMRTRYRDHLRLDQLSREAGLSPQHLSRLFREEAGMTPIRFLWRIREEEGARLLRETGLTVTEIAECCGFQNPFHFTRRIRQRFGEPPRSLRQRHWTGH